MSTETIQARPERTSTQIAADRKEANAFFARMVSLNARQIQRIVREAGIDSKLGLIISEANGWADVTLKGQWAEEARRKKNKQICLQNLRPYVNAQTKAKMPAPQIHPRSADERKLSTWERHLWHRRIVNPSPLQMRRTVKDTQPHVQWLAENPHYGPLYGPDPQADKLLNRPRAIKGYQRRTITPTGMTARRALEIAINALNNK